MTKQGTLKYNCTWTRSRGGATKGTCSFGSNHLSSTRRSRLLFLNLSKSSKQRAIWNVYPFR
ncbi:hypothetical protein H5410_035105 [Solanum commersonii]|uniref:Uncharacterized protein n=1 Tax=Solanum commersonii TaxID=4109 RepID=A0A9J5Y0A7_SOLCO|nr:hypothetical protein H5410_035105 [Solanum commersonii]